MTTLLLRVLERIHGHMGWLGVAALIHPAILQRATGAREGGRWPLARRFVTHAWEYTRSQV